MRRGGIFITFEGGEGSGKSTQAKRLARWLKKRGHRVVLTSEPGGTPAAEAVRRLLLHDRFTWTPMAELLLFLTCRAQLVEEVIRPALKNGMIVLCDRYADSTLAYQGYGRGFSLAQLKRMNREATGGLQPDLTIFFRIPVEEGLRRARRRGPNRFEGERLAFHQKVVKGFEALARRDPKRIRPVQVRGTKEETERAVWDLVEAIGL